VRVEEPLEVDGLQVTSYLNAIVASRTIEPSAYIGIEASGYLGECYAELVVVERQGGVHTGEYEVCGSERRK